MRRQSRDRCGSVTTQGGDGFYVRLDPRPAARVRTCDDQYSTFHNLRIDPDAQGGNGDVGVQAGTTRNRRLLVKASTFQTARMVWSNTMATHLQ